MNNKSFLIVVLILSLAAIVSLACYLPSKFESSGRISLADFPKQIGDWIATDMPIGESAYKNLGTKNIILREYKNPKNDSVFLYIIYSERNRQIPYPLEVCYLGTGATIVKKSVKLITPSIKATEMLLEQGNNRQIVVNWFKAGNSNTVNYIKQQLKIITDQMLFKKTSGAMLSLSINIKKNDEPTAFKTLQEFASLIEPLLAKYVP